MPINIRSPEYYAWCNMIQRCYNPRNKDYFNYGGRGIRVCRAWQGTARQFLADMGERPGPEYTLERRRNSGNYTPGNCYWATRKAQATNRRPTRTSAEIEKARAAVLPPGKLPTRIPRKKAEVTHGFIHPTERARLRKIVNALGQVL